MANKFTFGSGSFGNTGTFGKTNENAGAGKSRAPFVQFDDLDDDQKTQYQAGYKDWLDQNPDDYVGAALHGEDRLFTWQNNSKYFNDQGGIVSGTLNTGASALRPSMQFDDLNDDDKRRYQLGYKSVYDPQKRNFLEAASAGEAAVRETRLSLDQQLGESMLGDLGKPRDQMPLYLKDPAYIADLLRMNGATQEQIDAYQKSLSPTFTFSGKQEDRPYNPSAAPLKGDRAEGDAVRRFDELMEIIGGTDSIQNDALRDEAKKLEEAVNYERDYGAQGLTYPEDRESTLAALQDYASRANPMEAYDRQAPGFRAAAEAVGYTDDSFSELTDEAQQGMLDAFYRGGAEAVKDWDEGEANQLDQEGRFWRPEGVTGLTGYHYEGRPEKETFLGDLGKAANEEGQVIMKLALGLLAGEDEIDLSTLHTPTLDKWTANLDRLKKAGSDLGQYLTNWGDRWQDVKALFQNLWSGMEQNTVGAVKTIGEWVSGETLYHLLGEPGWMAPGFIMENTGYMKGLRAQLNYDEAARQDMTKDMLARNEKELIPVLGQIGIGEEDAKTTISLANEILSGTFQNFGNMGMDFALGVASFGAGTLSSLRNVLSNGAENLIAMNGGSNIFRRAINGISAFFNHTGAVPMIMSSYGRNLDEIAAEKGGAENLTSADYWLATGDAFFNSMIELGGGEIPSGVQSWLDSRTRSKGFWADRIKAAGNILSEVLEEEGQDMEKMVLENFRDAAEGRTPEHALFSKDDTDAIISMARAWDVAVKTAGQTALSQPVYEFAGGSMSRIVNKVIAGENLSRQEKQAFMDLSEAMMRMQEGTQNPEAEAFASQEVPQAQNDAFEAAVNGEDLGRDRTPGTDPRAQAAVEEEAAGNQGTQAPKGNPKDMRAVREATERKAEADQAEQEFRAEQDKMLELERKNATPEELDAQQAILDQAKAKLDKARDRYHQAAELANQESTLVPEEGYTAEEVQNIVNNGGTAEGQRKQEPNRPVKEATERTTDEEAPQAEEAESGQQPFRKPERPVKDATERTADEIRQTLVEAEQNVQNAELMLRNAQAAKARAILAAMEEGLEADERARREQAAQDAIKRVEALQKEYDRARAAADAAARGQNEQAENRRGQEAQAGDRTRQTLVETGEEEQETAQRKQAPPRAVKGEEGRPADEAQDTEQETAQRKQTPNRPVKDATERTAEEVTQELVNNGEGPGPDQVRPGYAGEEQEKPEKKPAPRPENEQTTVDLEPPTQVNPETPQTAQDDRQEGTPQEEEVQQELVNNGEGPGPDQVRPGNVGEEQEKPGRKPAPVPENEKTPDNPEPPAPVNPEPPTPVNPETPQTAQDNPQAGTPPEAEEEEGIGKQEEKTGLTEEKTETGNTAQETDEDQERNAGTVSGQYGWNHLKKGEQAKTGVNISSWSGTEVTDAQRADLSAVDMVAKDHNLIVVMDSTLEKGRANGYYTERDSQGRLVIHIAQDAENPIRTVFSHELAHLVRANNPRAWNSIVRVWDEYMRRGGVDIANEMEKLRTRYREAGLKVPSENRLTEELIADSLYDVIGDERTVRALAMSDRGVVRQIRDWVSRVMADIRRMLNRYADDHPGARTLRDTEGAMQKLRDMIDQALADIDKVQASKKAVQALGENGEMTKRYQEKVKNAASRQEMNAAADDLAWDMLEEMGESGSKAQRIRLMNAAKAFVTGGGTMSEVLRDYGFTPWGQNEEMNRAFAMLGKYAQGVMKEGADAYVEMMGLDEESEENSSGFGSQAEQDKKYSVMSFQRDGKTFTFVKADRKVIKGNNPKKWKGQIYKYIHEQIRHGEDVTFLAVDGTPLTITEDTEGKAKFRNKYENSKEPYNDTDYALKLRMEAHIDELAQVSEGKDDPVPDEKNHPFAKDGFNYRTAYFWDFDGRYYSLRISVGKNGVVNTIYNINRMNEMPLPEELRATATDQVAVGKGSADADQAAAIGEHLSNSKPQSDEDVKRSLKKSTTDQAYQKAVDNGDMETAQRMVDQAAKEAGYTLYGYHGSKLPTLRYDTEGYGSETDYANKRLPFTVFKPGPSGGIYVATNREVSTGFAKNWRDKHPGTVMNLYARLKNPLIVNEHVWTSVPHYYNIPTPSVMLKDGYAQKELSTEEISHYAQEHGYDGVIIEGIREGADTQTDDIIVFNPKQLKLADPVVYDDAGNVIPLSERFNDQNDDIRYSAKEGTGETSAPELTQEEFQGLQERNAALEEEVRGLQAKAEQADSAARQLAQEVLERNDALEQLKQSKATRQEVANARAMAKAAEERFQDQLMQALEYRDQRDRAVAEQNRLRAQLGAEKRNWRAKIRKQEEARVAGQVERLKKNNREWKKEYREKAEVREKRRKNLDRIVKETNKLQQMIAHPGKKKGYVPEGVLKAAGEWLNALNEGRGLELSMAGRALQRQMNKALNKETDGDQRVFSTQLLELMDEALGIMEDAAAEAGETVLIRDLTPEQIGIIADTAQGVNRAIELADRLIGRESYQEVQKESESMIRTAEKHKVKLKGAGRLAWKYMIQHMNPQTFFQVLGHHENNALTRSEREMTEGTRKRDRIMMKATKIFEPLTTGANEKKFDRMTGKNAEWYDTGIPVLNLDGSTTGRTMEMTQGMRVSLWLNWQSEDNRQRMCQTTEEEAAEGKPRVYVLSMPDKELFTKGKVEEAYKRGYRVTVTEAQVNAILDEMTDYEMDWAHAWQKAEETVFRPAINETSMEMNGWEIAGVDNYFPIITNPNFVGKDFESVVSDSRLTSMGILKERVEGAKNPTLLMDIADVVGRQIDSVASYAGLAIPVQNFTRVWNGVMPGYTQSVKEAMINSYGPEAVRYIEDFMRDIQGGSRMPNGFMSKLRSRYAGAVLTFSPATTIKQSASLLAAAGSVSWESLAKSVRYFATPKRIDPQNIMDRYTAAHWVRESNSLAGLEANANRNNKAKKGLFRMGNTIQAMDLLTTKVLWKAAEFEIQKTTDLRPGAKEDIEAGTDAYYKAVAAKYEEILETSQPQYGAMQKNAIQRSQSELVRSLTMFKTQPFQNMNLLINSVTNYTDKAAAAKANPDSAEAKAALGEARVKLARTVSGQVASAVMVAVMTALGKALQHKMGGYRDDKGDITPESVGAQLMRDSASSVMGMVAGGTELYNLVDGLIQGRSPYDIEAAGVSTVNELYQNTYNLWQASTVLGDADMTAEEKWNKMQPKLWKFAGSLSQIFGWPTENVRGLIDGIAANTKDMIAGKPFSYQESGLSFLGAAQGRETSNSAVAGYIAQAMMDGNEAEATRLYNEQLRQGKKADALNTAIATWQKANIPEIREAAEAIDSGDLTEYNRLINEIVGKGVSMTNAVKYVEAERKKSQEGSSNTGTALTYQEILDGMTKETATSEANAYTNGMMNSLLEDGNVDAAKAIRDDMLANGKKAASINSSLTSYWKPLLQAAYDNGDMAEVRRITAMLVEMGLKRTTVSGWTQEKSGSSSSSSKKKSGFGSGSFGSGSFGSSKKSSKKSGFGSGSFGSGKFGS